jgi:hypothetical protein
MRVSLTPGATLASNHLFGSTTPTARTARWTSRHRTRCTSSRCRWRHEGRLSTDRALALRGLRSRSFWPALTRRACAIAEWPPSPLSNAADATSSSSAIRSRGCKAPHSQTELSVVSRWLAVAKLVEIRSVLGAVDPEARETEERERVEDQEHRDSYE